MGRQPCCAKVGLKRGPWTIEEDHRLMTFIINNGIQCWRTVPKLAGLLRCGKSCRLRWINYLRPDLKRGELSEFEENQIIQLHARLGNRWSKIASHFPGRTDNEIKNQWNTRIKKRLRMLGVDPVTHKLIEQQQQQCIKEETIPFEQNSNSSEEHKEPQITHSVTSAQEVSQVEEMKHEASNDAMNLGQGYEMLLRGRNEEPVMHSEIAPSSDNSFSISIDESLTYSLGESSSKQQDSQNWLPSIDSFLSWDSFNPFEDFLGFGNYN